MARVWTLIALVALLLMPVAMAGAPAMAEPAPAAAGHCDEHQQPADAPMQAQVHCTGCVALPAAQVGAPEEPLRPQAPAERGLAETLSDSAPATDPPPPKVA